MANEIPIDVVLRAQDEMSAVLDKAAKESLELADSFKTAEDAAKKATGITWDETTKRWRDANRGFISSQKALEAGFTDADKAVFKYERQIKEAAKATDSMGKSMAEGGAASSGFGVKMVALGNIAGDLAMRALSAVASTVGDVVKAMIDGNAEFERYETQFGVLIGGSENAKKRLQELAEFGAKTPFELPEVVRADKVLQGFGLHSEEAAKKFGFSGTQIRTIAGDLAAGTGQNFEDMARYLGMFASGATGEAISRFQELGITTREELGKLGLEFSKSGELTTPTQEAFTVLLNVAQKKFGGMMDAQSKTFEGMMSNLEDWKGNTLRTIGEPIFEVLRDKLGVLLEFLGSPAVKNAISDFAKDMADTLRTVVAWVERNWPTIQRIITDVFNAVRWAVDNVIRPTVNFLSRLFDDTYSSASENFGAIRNAVDRAITEVQRIINSVMSAVYEFWAKNGADIMADATRIWETISSIVTTAVEVIMAIINLVLPQVTDAVEKESSNAQTIFKVAWDAIVLVVDIALQTLKGLLDLALALMNGDMKGAWEIIKNTIKGVWDTIYEVIRGPIESAKTWINYTFAVMAQDLEFVTNSIRNRLSATFQGMRDDITLYFTQLKNNAISTFNEIIRLYNIVAPFMGLVPINAGLGMRGASASSATTTNINLTANYGYQNERSLRDDVQTLQMLYGGA
jgi:phage-related protein